MTSSNLTAGAKYSALFWVLISLGSCAVIQNYDNRVMTFNLEYPTGSKRCDMFVRTQHLGHHEPIAADVDPSKMTPEEFTEVVMTHAELLKAYVDKERAYLAEDVARHMDSCK